MYNPNDTIKPVFFGNINEVFDEKGSAYIAIRKTQWVKNDNTPDESKAKLELRKWRTSDDGEKPDKGFSFLTDEGPHELVNVLLRNNFGHTKDVLKILKTRDDFKESVEHLYDKEEDKEDGSFFDMRDALLAEDEDKG